MLEVIKMFIKLLFTNTHFIRIVFFTAKLKIYYIYFFSFKYLVCKISK